MGKIEVFCGYISFKIPSPQVCRLVDALQPKRYFLGALRYFLVCGHIFIISLLLLTREKGRNVTYIFSPNISNRRSVVTDNICELLDLLT